MVIPTHQITHFCNQFIWFGYCYNTLIHISLRFGHECREEKGLLNEVCHREPGDTIKKRAIIQTTAMKEENVHSGQLARTDMKCL
jgi:hypothetical protein